MAVCAIITQISIYTFTVRRVWPLTYNGVWKHQKLITEDMNKSFAWLDVRAKPKALSDIGIMLG